MKKLIIIALLYYIVNNQAIAEIKITTPDGKPVPGNTVIPNPEPVIPPIPDAPIYTKAFAKRFNLKPAYIHALPTGIAAIDVTYNDDYIYYYGNDEFSKRYNLINLTAEQKALVNKHLEIFPLLFAGEKMPLTISHSCNLNLFLNDNNPLIHSLQLPEKDSTFGSYQGVLDVTREALGPIAELQTGAQHEETLNLIKHAADNYYGLAYLKNGDDKLNLPYDSYRILFLSDMSFISLGPLACEAIRPNSVIYIKKINREFYQLNLPAHFSKLVQTRKPKQPVINYYKSFAESID